MLSIIYVTGRKEPFLEWFLDSLTRESGGDFSQIEVIMVDYWANPFGGTPSDHEDRRTYVESRIDDARIPHEAFNWLAPKPTPWQGKSRQTKEDWFNVANSRNTGLCYAHGEWVAFCDDLSVLMPGWLACVFQAMQQGKTITLGSYRKVFELLVEQGEVKSHRGNITDSGFDAGMDGRMKHAEAGKVKAPCPPDWHYGYVVGPLEAYLEVNGWVETETAGLGFEDVPTGINLGKKGYRFRYDPRMVAWESEEGHSQGLVRKADYGESPKDKSHAVLENAKKGDGFARNNFWNGMTLRELRDFVHMKATNPFPAPPQKVREWFTGKLLWDL